MKTKICTKCKKSKNLSEFYKDKQKKDRLCFWCKGCSDKRYNKYIKTLSAKINKQNYMKEYDVKRKMVVKEKNLINKYGMTLDEWNKLFQEQNGRCAICNIHQSELHWGLCVDHNHNTGHIRGLVCHKCNDGIGRLRADEGIYILKQAIKYIKKRDFNGS